MSRTARITSTTTRPAVSSGWAAANQARNTAIESSARLSVQLLTGSGAGVRRGARRGLGAVRGERHAAREQRRADLPLLGDPARERAVGEERRRRGSDEGVDRVPDAVHVRDLVGDELDQKQRDGEAQHDWVGQDLERLGEVDDAEPLEQSGGGDGGVEVESRRERGAEREAEGLERGHAGKLLLQPVDRHPAHGGRHVDVEVPRRLVVARARDSFAPGGPCPAARSWRGTCPA